MSVPENLTQVEESSLDLKIHKYAFGRRRPIVMFVLVFLSFLLAFSTLRNVCTH